MQSSTVSQEELQAALEESMRRTLHGLKATARAEGITISGTKAVLQGRLQRQLVNYARQNDVHGFRRLHSFLSSNEPSRSARTAPATAPQPLSMKSQPISELRAQPAYNQNQTDMSSTTRLRFKQSPFYTSLRPITQVHECKARETTRDTIDIKLRLSPELASAFEQNGSTASGTRLLIYSAAEPVSAFTESEISFPNSIEVKVNGADVKANYRGLKNRPGTTRPVDITNLVRKASGYDNLITVTFALTTKRYYFVVMAAEGRSCESLLQELQQRRSISAEQVIREMKAKAEDADIETTSTKLSLKCPLSARRIETPCRSAVCTHNQCFDGLSFLQLQQQGPTWTCPVCNKAVSFHALQVDQYVSDILRSTPQSVDQVTIEPDGRWRIPEHETTGPAKGEDLEIIEVAGPQQPIPNQNRQAEPKLQSASLQTPPASSREQSTASNVLSVGSKRPASAVVDLTLSSDDEDSEGAIWRRPVKRLSQTASQDRLYGLSEKA